MQKYLFLLRERDLLPESFAFYDFVPYKYGPYSFLAAHEINQLSELGLIHVADKGYRLGSKHENFNLNQLPSDVGQGIRELFQEVAGYSQRELIDSIYLEFPWYAHRSQIAESKTVSRPQYRDFAVFTIGYENISIDLFLDILLRERIKRIIDVRNTPLSRKFGFSKSQIDYRCKQVGIEYISLPDLGIKRNIRKGSQSRKTILKSYEANLSGIDEELFDYLLLLIASERSVLLCFEQEPEICHRKPLANSISRYLDIPTVHFNRGKLKWEKELSS